MHTIENAYDAYWFLYNHPKCIEVDPQHPLVDPSEYESEGMLSLGIGARKGKKKDDEYQLALEQHRMLDWFEGQFIHNLDIYYTKVNPVTRMIEDDKSLNTQVAVWLENGPAMWESYINQYIDNVHDIDLDSGGDTFEEALINMANTVKEKYGDYDVESDTA